jgi:hypothetical protein
MNRSTRPIIERIVQLSLCRGEMRRRLGPHVGDVTTIDRALLDKEGSSARDVTRRDVQEMAWRHPGDGPMDRVGVGPADK